MAEGRRRGGVPGEVESQSDGPTLAQELGILVHVVGRDRPIDLMHEMISHCPDGDLIPLLRPE